VSGAIQLAMRAVQGLKWNAHACAPPRTSVRCLLIVLALCLVWPSQANAEDVRVFKSPQARSAQLRIHGTTDLERFAAIITDYQRLHPGTEITYADVLAKDIYRQQLTTGNRRGKAADVLISSGMDLQFKLVNDGYARPHRSAAAARLPSWSRWRDEVFGIGYEPVVIVYNQHLLAPERVPRTRRQLLALLRQHGAKLTGRVGMYDAARSSVGYLLATQDHQLGNMASALQDALGDYQVVLEDRARILLERVARGELVLAYNVLGSYARARVDSGAPLGVVMPEDYTLMLLRTALIPRSASNAAEAGRFLDYLLSARGQAMLSQQTGVHPVIPAPGEAPLPPQLRPIPLGPGLLVYLDSLKRQQFLEAWRSTVLQSEQPAATP